MLNIGRLVKAVRLIPEGDFNPPVSPGTVGRIIARRYNGWRWHGTGRELPQRDFPNKQSHLYTVRFGKSNINHYYLEEGNDIALVNPYNPPKREKKEPTERMRRLIDFDLLYEKLPYGKSSGQDGSPPKKSMKPALLEIIALISDYAGGAKVRYKGATATRIYLKYEIARNAPVDPGFLVAADFIRDQGYEVEVIEQRGTDNVANVDYVKIVIS